MAEAAFRYIANHPWIQPFSIDDLHVHQYVAPQKGPKLERFNPAKSGTYAPVENNIYLYKVFNLVSSWASSPHPSSDCRENFDIDGQNDCILASDSLLVIINSSGATLDFLFFRNEDEIHQIVTNIAQLFPKSILINGSSTDRTAILPILSRGAFADDSSHLDTFHAYPSSGKITFTSHENALEKTYILIPDGLRVEIKSDEQLITQIPLALDPWKRFSPGWQEEYSSVKSSKGWVWSINNGPQVEINSTASQSFSPFTASLPDQKSAEDPNFDYPRGHFLPFPVALFETLSFGDFSIDLHIRIDQDLSSITSK